MTRLLRRLWYWAIERLAGADVVTDIRRLLSLVRKPRWTTPVLFVLGLLSSVAEAVGITLILLFFYVAMGQTDMEMGGIALHYVMGLTRWLGDTSTLAVAILFLIIARAMLTWLYSTTSARVSEAISQQARNQVHRRYLKLDFGKFQQHDTAQLMETLGSETWLVAHAYRSWTRLMINGCSVVVFTSLLLALSWKITAVAILGSLAINLVSRQLARRARVIGSETRAIHRDMGEQMLMTLQGMRAIRAYGQEGAHQSRFEDSSERARAASLRIEKMTAWLAPLTEVGYLGILCLIIAGMAWWGTGFAVTLAAVVLLYRLQPHFRELESNLLSLAQMQPQLHSVRLMMETPTAADAPATAIDFRSMEKAISFNDVRFRYPGSEDLVLRDVSFTIPVGQTTALIGASGSGKTTIVNLLLRLYSPEAGSIEIDGQPLNAFRRAEWLSGIAVAGQDIDLVEGTVIDNIRMADAYATEDQVVAVAKDAGVSEFIEGQPYGYETWIGQEGMRFSGGQRQRIGLARALLRDPDFMILDEAMSALDHRLEDRIRGEIARRMSGRTTLLITHRLELVREADHVVWIEDGKVRAQGPVKQILDLAIASLGRSVP